MFESYDNQEIIYGIISKAENFIGNKDYSLFIDEVLSFLYDNDADIDGLIEVAKNNEDDKFVKYATRFKKENGLIDEDDMEEEEY